MDLDAGELRAFVTVAEELHFGRAALRLDISQPQVSRRVRALEETLGVELFVRTARRTMLTDAGECCCSDARDSTCGRRPASSACRGPRGVGRAGRVVVGFLLEHAQRFPSRRSSRPPPSATMRSSCRSASSSPRDRSPSLRRGDVDLAIGARRAKRARSIESTLRREPSVLAMRPTAPVHARRTAAPGPARRLPMVALQRDLAPRPTTPDRRRRRARGAIAHRPAAALAGRGARAGQRRDRRLPAPVDRRAAASRGHLPRDRGRSGRLVLVRRRRLPRRRRVATSRRSRRSSSLMRDRIERCGRRLWKERWPRPSLREPCASVGQRLRSRPRGSRALALSLAGEPAAERRWRSCSCSPRGRCPCSCCRRWGASPARSRSRHVRPVLAAGHRLIVALAEAGSVYALSLMRGPLEDALTAAASGRAWTR